MSTASCARCASRIRKVPSVDAPSMTMCSTAGQRWARTLANASAIVSTRLNTAVMTEIRNMITRH
jgi:hypothetical protein